MDGRCDTDGLAERSCAAGGGRLRSVPLVLRHPAGGCDWAGIAELGTAERPQRNSWYNSFHSCAILVQEPGHNFGMVHSSAMRCTRDGQPVPIAWPGQGGAQCKHVEYGNPFDPMGGGDATT